jgi:hypothetical protein
MKQPVKYTISNINGKYYVSDLFEINEKTDVIRVMVLDKNSDIDKTVKKIYINGIEIDFKSYYSAYTGFNTNIICMNINEFLKSTNDLNVELIENSKIEIVLFFYKNKI